MKYLKEEPKKFLMDGTKMAWYGDKLSDFMNGERIMPVTVDMGIHKGCNMRCIFCYGDYQQHSSDHIPTDRLLQFAADAGAVGLKGCAIIGDGEPTMNRGLYQFVEALKANGVEPAIATNGLLLDDRKTEILTKNCTWIRFTICATGEKYREIHRGTPEGSFEKISDTIAHAVEHKGDCTIGLQMVLVPQCFDQIIPMAEFAIKLGVDYFQIKQFSDAGEGMPMHFDMNEYAKVEKDLKKAEAMSTKATEIIVKWRAMEDTKNITMDGKWEFDRCLDLPFLFQISGNGKCYPCGYMFTNDEYCYGDLTKETLAEILSGDRYWAVIDKIAKIPMSELCQGQCRHACGNEFLHNFIKAYKENGDNTGKALAQLCGGREQFEKLLNNPPSHMSFI